VNARTNPADSERSADLKDVTKPMAETRWSTSVGASGILLNPWYALPIHVPFVSGDWSSQSQTPRQITEPCCIDLNRWNLTLCFRNDQVIFIFASEDLTLRNLINPISYFLSYRTFIDYNVIGAAWDIDSSNLTKVEKVRFNVERRVERELPRDGSTVLAESTEQEWLELYKDDLVKYLEILNPTLYYALAFYLRGCAHQRYFLVEF